MLVERHGWTARVQPCSGSDAGGLSRSAAGRCERPTL